MTWNGGGNVPPTLSIARKLVARGHRVRVIAPESLADAVHAQGCTFVAFARAPERTKSSGTLLARPRTLGRALELARTSPAGAFAADLLGALDTEAADALVIDFMLAGAIAAAEHTRLPTAALMHTVYCLPTPGRPPFGPGPAPSSGSPVASATSRSSVWRHPGGAGGCATSTTRASASGWQPSPRRASNLPASTGSW